ncbi:CsgG/HfaB family protein [Sphingomonas carotinifaciens]|uniref:Curli production assembly/transport component CsgG n=1 Tax=Sphingomonas carotinifaciens TaxID=1166323 RepID=A0A1G7QVP3_9SPHN|nr:CsgG/HfaB family protein [Sphingomonas carotinifaciens]MBB4087885.1 curli production assembly/transport component CsgG [Sphingomonas carotinifaciens]MWC42371.1 curlin [Sphingomonas carotinifaciens]SDG02596.1 curli production assembly/transport component CsgG [Sphingomonas carotinifaciens]
MRASLLLMATGLTASLSGCAAYDVGPARYNPQAYVPAKTPTELSLNKLPVPARQVAVAVYGFGDQTGQFKPSETGQTLSRAVTQGAGSILMKALQDAGNRQWFTVVEREQFKNLLNERQVIREMRERYLGETAVNPQALPALLFAGVLLEGGVIGYDTNTVTGGAGAAFLGLGAHTQYRQDTVTVYLRAVSVRTGEVLTSVTTSKTIASRSLNASTFRYVAFKELLQAEMGITTNEPDQLALRQAIEKAVYSLVMEGVELKLWNFKDPAAGTALLRDYKIERDGQFAPEQVQTAMKAADAAPPLKILATRDRLKDQSASDRKDGSPKESSGSGGAL